MHDRVHNIVKIIFMTQIVLKNPKRLTNKMRNYIESQAKELRKMKTK